MLSAISTYALEAGSARLFRAGRRCLHARPKGLGDDLGRHFLKCEGALIRYPCAFDHFFTEFFLACTHAERNRRRSRISSRTKLRAKINSSRGVYSVIYGSTVPENGPVELKVRTTTNIPRGNR